MKKNIRRMIVSVVVIFTLLITGYVMKSYMEKKYAKDEFAFVNITITNNIKKNENKEETKEENHEGENKEDASKTKAAQDMEKFSKREVLDAVKDVFPKEKDVAVEELNFFGNEFRVKAKEITDEEKENIKNKLTEKYKEKNVSVSVSNVNKFPARQKNQDLKMYIIYIAVILLVNFAAIYFIDLAEKRRD